jgi:hypothetical protein
MGGRVIRVAVSLVFATFLVAAGGVAAEGTEAVAPAAGGTVLQFDAFCATWMQKLRDRASFNLGRIEWTPEGDAVVGEHVDYGTECACVTRQDPGREPIGKITYREVRFRRRGVTPEAALATPGTVVERFDVTEIFRHADGRWQY